MCDFVGFESLFIIVPLAVTKPVDVLVKNKDIKAKNIINCLFITYTFQQIKRKVCKNVTFQFFKEQTNLLRNPVQPS